MSRRRASAGSRSIFRRSGSGPGFLRRLLSLLGIGDYERCHWSPRGVSVAQVLDAFSVEQTTALTGLSKRQLFYWDRTGFFPPRFVVDRRRVYSFRDLVGLRTIAILRERGVPLQKLREVGRYLHQYSDTPWSSLAIYEFGGNVYFRTPDSDRIRQANRHEQGVTIELKAIAKEMTDTVRRATARQATDRGRVAKKRSVMANQPVIAGTRIRTEAIWNFYRDGYSVKEILDQYPSLSEEDVRAAIEFEQRRAATR